MTAAACAACSEAIPDGTVRHLREGERLAYANRFLSLPAVQRSFPRRRFDAAPLAAADALCGRPGCAHALFSTFWAGAGRETVRKAAAAAAAAAAAGGAATAAAAAASPDDASAAWTPEERAVEGLTLLRSRPRTVIEALARLGTLDAPVPGGVLVLHIAGADGREATTETHAGQLWGPVFDHAVASAAGAVSAVRVLLVGPNVSARLDGTVFESVAGRDLSVGFVAGLHHERCNARQDPCFGFPAAPHAVFAFNAGVWGYDTWLPTVRHAVSNLRCPFVITAYNLDEADDDLDALRNVFPEGTASGGRWEWAPELNPYRALAIRDRTGAMPNYEAENCAWQAIGPAAAEQQAEGEAG